MRWRHLVWYAAAFLPFSEHTVVAADYPTIIGVGLSSCGAWTAAKNGQYPLQYQAWLLGYLSAANRYLGAGTDFLEKTDAAGAFAWMDNYCQSHPLSMIETATKELAEELRQRSQNR
jgi:hypothetical protein